MRLAANNPMARVLGVLLGFEAVVFGLAVPGMIQVDGLTPATAFATAGVGAFLAVVAAATLRRGWGYPLGWLTQVAAVALGVLTPMMYLAGGMFALLWVVTFVLGRKLDAKSA